MIDSIDYSNYDNNDKFDFNPFKGIICIIIALVICFIYACTNEYHQTFVNGRTGQFSDTLIDTFGGFISCLMYIFMMKINKIRKKYV